MADATTTQMAHDVILFGSPGTRQASPSNSTIFSLPFHVLCYIFLKLPHRAIAQCARVCSTWRTLFHEPCFTNQHLSLYPPTPSLVLRTRDYYEKHTTLRVVARKAIHQVKIPYRWLELVGSFNGIVCLSDYHTKIVLCIPSMGAHLFLPECEGPIYGIGFGYIPSTHQYKVVWISIGRKGKRKKCFVSTMSGKGNTVVSCKRVPRGYRELFFGDSGRSVFYNGAVIWISDTRKAIIYFEFSSEKFGYVSFPSNMFGGKISIGVFYDDKGIGQFYIAERSTTTSINIWLAEDYKCVTSVKLKWILREEPRSSIYGVLKVLKDGRLLISQSGSVVTYDTKTNSIDANPKSKLVFSGWRDQALVDAPSILGCPL